MNTQPNREKRKANNNYYNNMTCLGGRRDKIETHRALLVEKEMPSNA